MGYRPLEERRIAGRTNVAGDRPPSREAHESTPTGGRRRAWTRVARGKADAAVANLSAPVAGALAAAWGAFATLMAIGLLMISIWIFGAGEGSAMGALQSAGNAWLIAHLVPISNSGTLISLLPLGLVLIPGFLLWRAGTWAARRSGACYWREVRTTVFMASAVYASIAMMVAGVSGTPEASISPILAIIICGIFAFIVFGGAAFYEAGLWPRAVARVAQPVRFRIRVAIVVALTVLAGSAGLIAIGLVLNWGDAIQAQELLGVGLIGTIGLLLVTLAYWPNALVWGASYISGVGYNVGGGGMVTPFSVEVGAIPALPLLAATPTFAAWYTWLVLLIPVAGGVVGTFYARKQRGLSRTDSFAWTGLDFAWIAGLVAATMIILSFFARGSLGSERMAGLGPGILGPGLALGILTLFGLLLGGALVRMSATRARRKGLVDLTDKVVDIAEVDQEASTPSRRRFGREKSKRPSKRRGRRKQDQQQEPDHNES